MSTVELSGARWRKSSRSNDGNNGNCVEVAFAGPVIAVRDSKDPAGSPLAFTATRWGAFLTAAKHGHFDQP